MKVCLSCEQRYEGDDWQCPACGFAVANEQGILKFAPGIARDGIGFNPAHFAELAQLESTNFWFRARNALLIHLLRTYIPEARKLLELGCGTGFVLSGIANAFPQLAVSGSELFAEGLSFAAERVRGAKLFQMDARAIPFENEFDVIGAFDVLEHIEEDERVLAQMHQAVVPGGNIILTVPQHRFLWSQQDDFACHVRRYEAADLLSKVERAGFSVRRMTSFVSLLLPVMYLARRRKRVGGKNFDPADELRIGGVVNAVAKAVLDFEIVLIRAGVSLPVGGSLVMIASKGR